MPHIMLDLETLGTKAGCIVLSVGAVYFDQGGLGAEFHQVISVKDSATYGLQLDVDTLSWWTDRDADAQATLKTAFGKEALPLIDVLNEFTAFVNNEGPHAFVWGNGADFDLPILEAAYVAVGQRKPWGNWSGRCYRTLKQMTPDIRIVRSGVHHNALDDAKSQAEHAVRLLNHFKSWPE